MDPNIEDGAKVGDPEVSGEIVPSIVQEKPDADVGCLVHKDGAFGKEGTLPT